MCIVHLCKGPWLSTLLPPHAPPLPPGFKPTAGHIDNLVFRPTPEVWGYFSVRSGGGIHEYSDSQVRGRGGGTLGEPRKKGRWWGSPGQRGRGTGGVEGPREGGPGGAGSLGQRGA